MSFFKVKPDLWVYFYKILIYLQLNTKMPLISYKYTKNVVFVTEKDITKIDNMIK